MNLGAFFATLLALAPSETTFQSDLMVNQPHAVAHTTLTAAPTQMAALPSDTDSETAPPAKPPAPPKVKPPRTAAAKKAPTPTSKPGTTTAQRKPVPKPQAATKPPGGGRTTAAACPPGSIKSATTGRCTPRAKAAAPPA